MAVEDGVAEMMVERTNQVDGLCLRRFQRRSGGGRPGAVLRKFAERAEAVASAGLVDA